MLLIHMLLGVIRLNDNFNESKKLQLLKCYISVSVKYNDLLYIQFLVIEPLHSLTIGYTFFSIGFIKNEPTIVNANECQPPDP